MMNINEYLNNLFNTQGYEAWEEENENLWNMYNTLTEEEVTPVFEKVIDMVSKKHNAGVRNK